ncbi:MAG: sulfatase [Chloroflexi bacterium]|nr:sulfatase [Chloroflexota bacterium]
MGTPEHRSRFVFPLILTLVVGMPFWSLVATSDAGQGTNVILITVDTLRADHLGVYGYARNTSPNVDRFAKESTLFRYAFSHAPETSPSLSSLMTSHYPHETKVLRNHYVLPSGAVTLAEILKARGYRTGAMVGNFTLRRGSGFEQGFDEYDDRMEDQASLGVERIAPKTTQAAIAWLERMAREKFFLWVHYNDPHGPYTPPAPYNTMFVEPPTGKRKTLPVNRFRRDTGGIPDYQVLGDRRDPEYYIAQYDGEIRFFDAALGELIKRIQDLGLLENSLVIFTADHGEGMGDHNYYFAHAAFLYNGLIHVPLIIRPPGKRSEEKEIRTPVAQVDLLPTILDTLALRVPQRFRGENLFAAGKAREIFVEAFAVGSQYAVIRHGMKMIQGAKGYEVYDLRGDFAEERNLMPQGANLGEKFFASSADLKKRLEAIRKQDALKLGRPILWSTDPETQKKLRSLGYVQ